MEISEDTSNSTYQITHYDEKSVSINAKSYTQSLMVSPDTFIPAWEVTSVKNITLETLEKSLALKPEILLIGTGATSKQLSPRLITTLNQQGVGVECMSTPAACRSYVILSSESRQVVAAIILEHV